MQARDLKPGDKFTAWEHEQHTVCIKTEDGHTYRLKDGSVIRLAHNKRVELLKQEEAGFFLTTYQNQFVLAKRLPGQEGSAARYVIKRFVAVETSFVISSELQEIQDTSTSIRKEVANPLAMAPQLLVVLQEIEQTLSRGTSFVGILKTLLQVAGTGAQVDHNPIMVNVKQLPTE